MNSNLLGSTSWREWLIGLLTIAAIAVTFSVAPIPQDPNYHQFADAKNYFGIANFFNVLSNAPFLLVGLYGLKQYYTHQIRAPRLPYLIFCVGVFFVGIGSAYYHSHPTSYTLVWDRLPMTFAFMALFAMVIADRVSERLASQLLWPLLIAGIASVGYWYWSESQRQGDLRAYALVQFLPILLIPLLLLLYPGKRMNAAYLWGTLAMYLLAKLAEHFDANIYAATGSISGHSIKHVLAAVAVWWVILAFKKNQHPTPAG